MIRLRLMAAAEAMGSSLVGADSEFTGCSIDSRTIHPGELFFALRGDHFDGHAFIADVTRKGAGGAVLERVPEPPPGIPYISVGDTRGAISRLAAHWRQRFTIPVVAVTGSNGKTTVKEMIASILSGLAATVSTRGNLNNELGVPLTLFSIGHEHRFAVIEMGANHPGEISVLTRLVRPTVAVITQCAPAHLEGFGSVAGVARAKAEIFEGLGANGIAVINIDDPFAAMWLELGSTVRAITFGFGRAARVTATDIHVDPATGATDFTLHIPGQSVPVRLPLPGRHNVANSLAAAACCCAIDVGITDIRRGLEKVSAIKGRLQAKAGLRGAVVIDDTYNANPGSLAAALECLQQMPGRHWLVLGDMGELGSAGRERHVEAGSSAREAGVERMFCVGSLSREAVAAFGNGACHYASMEQLLRSLTASLGAGITVLVKGSRSMVMEQVVEKIVAAG